MPITDNTDKSHDAEHDSIGIPYDGSIRTSSFTEALEEAIRNHVHVEMQGWFFYRKLSTDCGHANVALHGFASLWRRSAVECLADATWLETYLIQRGGSSEPTDLLAPNARWAANPGDPMQPVYEAVILEKNLLEDVQRLCSKALRNGDHALAHTLQTRFFRRKTRHVKDMGDLLLQCGRANSSPGLGLYELDKELRTNAGVAPWGWLNNADSSDQLLQSTTEDLTRFQPDQV